VKKQDSPDLRRTSPSLINEKRFVRVAWNHQKFLH